MLRAMTRIAVASDLHNEFERSGESEPAAAGLHPQDGPEKRAPEVMNKDESET